MRECSLAWLAILKRYKLSRFPAWVKNSQNKDVSKRGQKEQAAASEKQLLLTIFSWKDSFLHLLIYVNWTV